MNSSVDTILHVLRNPLWDINIWKAEDAGGARLIEERDHGDVVWVRGYAFVNAGAEPYIDRC